MFYTANIIQDQYEGWTIKTKSAAQAIAFLDMFLRSNRTIDFRVYNKNLAHVQTVSDQAMAYEVLQKDGADG